jgi:UDP-3-O-[3-hydroxymyristoyl] N-acetylglucosamine deacetylase
MVEKTSQAAVAQPDAAISSQATLAQGFEQRGVGLHSGLETWVRVESAPVDTGRVFVRTDLPEAPVIPATLAQVGQTLLSTELAVGEATIRTVEHLLAALIGHGVDNAQILVNGPEIPLLDGSAQPWSAAIAAAGIQPQAAPRAIYSVTAPVHIQSGDAFVMAMPAPEPRLTYGIDFEVTAIGNQWYSWSPVTDDFATLVAPARTFGLAYQVEYLRSQGLIKGGSLDNALVCDHDGWVNPPLRFENEPARHKLLDLLGDLSLLGALPQAHVVAYKASHQLHGQLAQAIAQQQNSG